MTRAKGCAAADRADGHAADETHDQAGSDCSGGGAGLAVSRQAGCRRRGRGVAASRTRRDREDGDQRDEGDERPRLRAGEGWSSSIQPSGATQRIQPGRPRRRRPSAARSADAERRSRRRPAARRRVVAAGLRKRADDEEQRARASNQRDRRGTASCWSRSARRLRLDDLVMPAADDEHGDDRDAESGEGLRRSTPRRDPGQQELHRPASSSPRRKRVPASNAEIAPIEHREADEARDAVEPATVSMRHVRARGGLRRPRCRRSSRGAGAGRPRSGTGDEAGDGRTTIAPNTKPHRTLCRDAGRAVSRATTVSGLRPQAAVGPGAPAWRRSREPGRFRARAVVRQEQLLERRFAAEQLDAPRGGEAPSAAARRCRRPGSGRGCPRPRPRRRPGTRVRSGAAVERRLDRQGREVAHLRPACRSRRARPARRIPTRSQSASTSLRMCDDRNTDCPSPRASATQARNACSISGSRPAVGSSSTSSSGRQHERRDQQQLLTVPLRVRPHLLRRVEREPFDQAIAVRLVDRAVDPAEQVQGLLARQAGPQARLTGHVREVPVGFDGPAGTSSAEDLGPPGRRPEEPEDQPDRRRLARAVRPQVAEDLTAADLEVEGEQGVEGPEPLRQADRPQRRLTHPCTRSWRLSLVDGALTTIVPPA